MQSLKQGVARRMVLRATDPIWQARYYDFNLWSERKFREKLRCIDRNPVKRGLVKRPEDWVWSSFRHYLTVKWDRWRSNRSGRRGGREQFGIFPAVKVRLSAENPRPSGAWTGHPRE